MTERADPAGAEAPVAVPALRSRLDVAALARLLEQAYGLGAVRCRLIKATIRDIYAVTAAQGRYILAIYGHGARRRGEIEAELDVLATLDAAGLPVAPALARPGGGRLLLLAAPEGPRYAALFTFLAGAPFSRTPDPAAAARYGQTVARLHRLADELPGRVDRPPIDVALLLDASLAAFAAASERAEAVAQVREAAAVLRPRLAALPTTPPAYGLVHGDVIPSNALLTPDGGVALLDFDFCGYGWRAYDIATYLAEVDFWDAGDAVAAAFLAGYEAVRPPPPAERATFPLFAAARNIYSLGVPARYVNEWGSVALPDRMIDSLLAAIGRNLAQLD